jgi:hypothetical protein
MKNKIITLRTAISTFSDWFDNKCGWFFCPPDKCGREKLYTVGKN